MSNEIPSAGIGTKLLKLISKSSKRNQRVLGTLDDLPKKEIKLTSS